MSPLSLGDFLVPAAGIMALIIARRTISDTLTPSRWASTGATHSPALAGQAATQGASQQLDGRLSRVRPARPAVQLVDHIAAVAVPEWTVGRPLARMSPTEPPVGGADSRSGAAQSPLPRPVASRGPTRFPLRRCWPGDGRTGPSTGD